VWVDQAFATGSALAASAWVLLLTGERWPIAQRIWAGSLVPVLLSLAYALIFPVLYARSPGGYGSIDDLLALLGSDRRIVLAAWFHYLAFDLVVGLLIVKRSRALGVAAWARVPALVLTFLFGPVGWLLFQAQMHWLRRRPAQTGR
jgi:hypothetical protein